VIGTMIHRSERAPRNVRPECQAHFAQAYPQFQKPVETVGWLTSGFTLQHNLRREAA